MINPADLDLMGTAEGSQIFTPEMMAEFDEDNSGDDDDEE